MSLVLAADYRVPDFDQWWATLAGDLLRLPGLGAHHVVVYRSLQDASRVFVTIGVREREPVDALLRSPVMFSWFDSAGVEEIPPMFAGEVVEKLDLDLPAGSPGLATGIAAADIAAEGAVIVAAIAPVGRREGLGRLRASVHAGAARLAASGVQRFWIYRALDDQAEVMILLQIATERQAEQWVRHPDAAAAFMAEAGAGGYPPLFVGRLVQAIEVPGT
jgi:heme-degrading monooxygenase HmoA